MKKGLTFIELLAIIVIISSAVIWALGCCESPPRPPVRFEIGEFVEIMVSGQKGQVVGHWWVYDGQHWQYRVRYASALLNRDGLVSKSTANAVSYSRAYFDAHELDNWREE